MFFLLLASFLFSAYTCAMELSKTELPDMHALSKTYAQLNKKNSLTVEEKITKFKTGNYLLTYIAPAKQEHLLGELEEQWQELVKELGKEEAFKKTHHLWYRYEEAALPYYKKEVPAYAQFRAADQTSKLIQERQSNLSTEEKTVLTQKQTLEAKILAATEMLETLKKQFKEQKREEQRIKDDGAQYKKTLAVLAYIMRTEEEKIKKTLEDKKSHYSALEKRQQELQEKIQKSSEDFDKMKQKLADKQTLEAVQKQTLELKKEIESLESAIQRMNKRIARNTPPAEKTASAATGWYEYIFGLSESDKAKTTEQPKATEKAEKNDDQK